MDAILDLDGGPGYPKESDGYLWKALPYTSCGHIFISMMDLAMKYWSSSYFFGQFITLIEVLFGHLELRKAASCHFR